MVTTITDERRLDFVLQYILNARRSGRSTDHDGEFARADLVKVANSLYDKALESCQTLEEPTPN